jgi:predicted nuclease with TOPRIM domain
MSEDDRFVCVLAYDIKNDTLVYTVLRNGVGANRDYTAKFEILDKNGKCVAVNPPVIDPFKQHKEAEAHRRNARIAELETRERQLEEMFLNWHDEARKGYARIAELEAENEKLREAMRPISQWSFEAKDNTPAIKEIESDILRVRAALNGEKG